MDKEVYKITQNIKFTKCSICNSNINHEENGSFILPCLRFVCGVCKNYVTAIHEHCMFCREQTLTNIREDAIGRNHLLSYHVTRNLNMTSCSKQGDDRIACSFCFTCRLFLCTECHNDHITSYDTHDVMFLTKMADLPVREWTANCNCVQHPNYPVTHCVRIDGGCELRCVICRTERYEKDEELELDSACDSELTKLQMLSEKLSKRISLQCDILQRQSQKEALKRDITETFESLEETLRSRYQELKSITDDVSVDPDIEVKLIEGREYARKVLRTSKHDFLTVMPVVERRLKSLLNTIENPVITHTMSARNSHILEQRCEQLESQLKYFGDLTRKSQTPLRYQISAAIRMKRQTNRGTCSNKTKYQRKELQKHGRPSQKPPTGANLKYSIKNKVETKKNYKPTPLNYQRKDTVDSKKKLTWSLDIPRKNNIGIKNNLTVLNRQNTRTNVGNNLTKTPLHCPRKRSTATINFPTQFSNNARRNLSGTASISRRKTGNYKGINLTAETLNSHGRISGETRKNSSAMTSNSSKTISVDNKKKSGTRLHCPKKSNVETKTNSKPLAFARKPITDTSKNSTVTHLKTSMLISDDNKSHTMATPLNRPRKHSAHTKNKKTTKLLNSPRKPKVDVIKIPTGTRSDYPNDNVDITKNRAALNHPIQVNDNTRNTSTDPTSTCMRNDNDEIGNNSIILDSPRKTNVDTKKKSISKLNFPRKPNVDTERKSRGSKLNFPRKTKVDSERKSTGSKLNFPRKTEVDNERKSTDSKLNFPRKTKVDNERKSTGSKLNFPRKTKVDSQGESTDSKLNFPRKANVDSERKSTVQVETIRSKSDKNKKTQPVMRSLSADVAMIEKPRREFLRSVHSFDQLNTGMSSPKDETELDDRPGDIALKTKEEYNPDTVQSQMEDITKSNLLSSSEKYDNEQWTIKAKSGDDSTNGVPLVKNSSDKNDEKSDKDGNFISRFFSTFKKKRMLIPAHKMTSSTSDVRSPDENLPTSCDKLDTSLDNLDTSRDNLDTSPDNLDTSRDNLDTSPDNLDMSHDNLDTSPDNLDTSRDNLDTSPDNLDTSHDNLDTSRDNRDTSHDNLDTSRDNLDRSRDNLDTAHDNVDRSRDNVYTSLDNLDTSSDNLDTSRDNLDTSRDNLDTSRDNHDKSRDNLDTSRDSLDTSRDNLDTSRDNQDTSRDNLDTSRDNLDTSRDNQDTSRDNLDTSRDNMTSSNTLQMVSDNMTSHDHSTISTDNQMSSFSNSTSSDHPVMSPDNLKNNRPTLLGNWFGNLKAQNITTSPDKQNISSDNVTQSVGSRITSPKRLISRENIPTSSDNYHTSPDTFQTSPDNFQTSRDKFQTSPDKFQTSPDKFQTSPDKFQTSRDKFQTSPEKFQTSPDKFQTSPDRFQTSPDKFQTSPDKFQTSPDKFQTSPDKFQTSPDRFQTSPDKFQTSPDKFQTSPDKFQTSPDKFQTDPDTFQTSTDKFQTSSDSFQTSPDNFQTSSDTFQTSPDTFQTSLDKFQIAPYTFQTSPNTFQTSPDSFHTYSDKFQTSPDTFQTSSDKFQTAPDTFQTSPNTFQTSPDTFQTSPDTFQTSSDKFQTTPDTFQTSPNTFQTSPDSFQTYSDKFQTSPDTFQTSPDTFQTSSDKFQTAPDTFQTSPNTFQTSPDSFHTYSNKFHTSPDTFQTSPDTFQTSPNTFQTSLDIFQTSSDNVQTSPDNPVSHENMMSHDILATSPEYLPTPDKEDAVHGTRVKQALVQTTQDSHYHSVLSAYESIRLASTSTPRSKIPQYTSLHHQSKDKQDGKPQFRETQERLDSLACDSQQITPDTLQDESLSDHNQRTPATNESLDYSNTETPVCILKSGLEGLRKESFQKSKTVHFILDETTHESNDGEDRSSVTGVNAKDSDVDVDTSTKDRNKTHEVNTSDSSKDIKQSIKRKFVKEGTKIPESGTAYDNQSSEYNQTDSCSPADVDSKINRMFDSSMHHISESGTGDITYANDTYQSGFYFGKGRTGEETVNLNKTNVKGNGRMYQTDEAITENDSSKHDEVQHGYCDVSNTDGKGRVSNYGTKTGKTVDESIERDKTDKTTIARLKVDIQDANKYDKDRTQKCDSITADGENTTQDDRKHTNRTQREPPKQVTDTTDTMSRSGVSNRYDTEARKRGDTVNVDIDDVKTIKDHVDLSLPESIKRSIPDISGTKITDSSMGTMHSSHDNVMQSRSPDMLQMEDKETKQTSEKNIERKLDETPEMHTSAIIDVKDTDISVESTEVQMNNASEIDGKPVSKELEPQSSEDNMDSDPEKSITFFGKLKLYAKNLRKKYASKTNSDKETSQEDEDTGVQDQTSKILVRGSSDDTEDSCDQTLQPLSGGVLQSYDGLGQGESTELKESNTGENVELRQQADPCELSEISLTKDVLKYDRTAIGQENASAPSTHTELSSKHSSENADIKDAVLKYNETETITIKHHGISLQTDSQKLPEKSDTKDDVLKHEINPPTEDVQSHTIHAARASRRPPPSYVIDREHIVVMTMLNAIKGTTSEIARVQIYDVHMKVKAPVLGELKGKIYSPDDEVAIVAASAVDGAKVSRLNYCAEVSGIHTLELLFKEKHVSAQLEFTAFTEDFCRDAVLIFSGYSDITIKCPYLELDKDVIYKEYRVKDDGTLSNKCHKKLKDERMLNKFRGGISTNPLTSDIQYWEIIVDVIIKSNLVGISMLFEAAVTHRDVIDNAFKLEGQQSAWGVTVASCKQHEAICMYTWAKGVANQHTKLPIINKQQENGVLHLGFLWIPNKSRLVIVDIKQSYLPMIIDGVDCDISLWPAWSVYNSHLADVTVRIVSGNDVMIDRPRATYLYETLADDPNNKQTSSRTLADVFKGFSRRLKAPNS